MRSANETVETWARSQIDASHCDQWHGGAMHGHSYTVWAAWNGEPLRDARELRRQLISETDKYDHKHLDDVLSDTSAENLARTIGRALPDCIAVIVERSDYRAVWKTQSDRLTNGKPSS